jgi:hypothetical protein
VQREVAGQLVAPIGDLDHRPRLPVPAPGVDLDHPELVRAGVDQLPDGRVLGEQPVPVGAVTHLDGAEQVGDGRRGQDRVGGDRVAAAVEGLELAREDVDGPDQQHRPRLAGRDGELAEVDQPLQRGRGRVVGPERLQQLAGGGRVVVEQGRPGEQGAHGPAGGAAEADDLDPGQLLGAEEALEHPDRTGCPCRAGTGWW